MAMGPSCATSVEPDAEKSGLATATRATMGSCQRRPPSVRRHPRAAKRERERTCESEMPTQTGCIAKMAMRMVAAKYVAGTAGWQVSKAVCVSRMVSM
jgi:hypothetical protein